MSLTMGVLWDFKDGADCETFYSTSVAGLNNLRGNINDNILYLIVMGNSISVVV